MSRCVLIVIGMGLLAGMSPGVHVSVAQESAVRSPPVDVLTWTAPAVIINTVPGFGLGSLAQNDAVGFRRGLVLDIVGVGLIAGGATWINMSNDENAAGPAVAALLSGYGVYAYSRVSGVVRPLGWAFREGIDYQSTFSPIFYNTVPGFGFGSALQGDQHGARVLRVADSFTVAMLGILSGAALGGYTTVSGVAAVSGIASFVFSQVYGIVRPVRIARQGASVRTKRNGDRDPE